MSIDEPAPTRLATLTLLLKQGQSSATCLSDSVGISVQAMRRHLRSLKKDGLVEAHQICNGPGRPSNLWKLTPKGENEFNYGNENFTIDLLNSIEANLPKEALLSLLSQQAREKANNYLSKIGKASIVVRLRKLIELRKIEGYLAEYEPIKEGKGWYINEFHCSIRKIAEQYPFVCDQELETIRYIFPDCQVERTQWRLEEGHSCGFRITPK